MMPRKAFDAPTSRQQVCTNLVSEFESLAIIRGRPQQLAERRKVLEVQHILIVRSIHFGLAVRTPTQMNECSNAEQKVIRIEVTSVVKFVVDFPAMAKPRAAKRPDPREESSQPFVLDVKLIKPVALADGRRTARASPTATYVQEMLERVEGRPDAVSKPGAKS